MTQGSDLGSLLGGLLDGGGRQGSSADGGILASLISAFMSKGGSNPLSELLDGLTKAGLTEQSQSWVGTGENKAVTGQQMRQAIPDKVLQHAAQQAGLSPEQAADRIAQELPGAVDKLSPNGQLPTSMDELIKQQRL